MEDNKKMFSVLFYITMSIVEKSFNVFTAAEIIHYGWLSKRRKNELSVIFFMNIVQQFSFHPY